MRKKAILFIISFSFFILSFSIAVAEKPQMKKDITASEAYMLIAEKEEAPDFIILDVRTDAEYQEGNIENALNIDYRGKDFSQRLEELDKDDTCLLYCRFKI